jgi:hypothetical protein
MTNVIYGNTITHKVKKLHYILKLSIICTGGKTFIGKK